MADIADLKREAMARELNGKPMPDMQSGKFLEYSDVNRRIRSDQAKADEMLYLFQLAIENDICDSPEMPEEKVASFWSVETGKVIKDIGKRTVRGNSLSEFLALVRLSFGQIYSTNSDDAKNNRDDALAALSNSVKIEGTIEDKSLGQRLVG